MTDLGVRVMVARLARGRGRGAGIPVEMLFTFLFSLRARKITQWQIFTREEDALRAAGIEQ
jgi:hypothetical protein